MLVFSACKPWSKLCTWITSPQHAKALRLTFIMTCFQSEVFCHHHSKSRPHFIPPKKKVVCCDFSHFCEKHNIFFIKPFLVFQVSQLLAGEDFLSALDNVLEKISDLQQLVSSWSDSLSEDDCQRGSSSSASSSSNPSSSQDSPAIGSSAASPCPSSPSHIHLEVQRPAEEEDDDEEEEGSHEKVPGSREELKMRSSQARSRWGSSTCTACWYIEFGQFKLKPPQFLSPAVHVLLTSLKNCNRAVKHDEPRLLLVTSPLIERACF